MKSLLRLGILVSMMSGAARTAHAGTILKPGNATSTESSFSLRGVDAEVYGEFSFDLRPAGRMAGIYGDAAEGGFYSIPSDYNGGSLYAGADASNISLRVIFSNVHLQNINKGAHSGDSGGVAHFGVLAAGTSFNAINPYASWVLAMDLNTDRHATEPQYYWQPNQQAGGSHASGYGPGRTWATSGGQGVSGQFDIAIEFAPQPDGTVRMYAFERQHANGAMLWTPQGAADYYTVLSGVSFPNVVNVFAGVSNGADPDSQGGNKIHWGKITVVTPDEGGYTPSETPEAGSLALLVLGLAVCGAARWLRNSGSTPTARR